MPSKLFLIISTGRVGNCIFAIFGEYFSYLSVRGAEHKLIHDHSKTKRDYIEKKELTIPWCSAHQKNNHRLWACGGT
jgi:hypothetical protein